MKKEDFFTDSLKDIRQANRERQVRPIQCLDGASVLVDGHRAINFCSNDYLGLCRHEKVVAAAVNELNRSGAGTGAARLITGTRNRHLELENALADFVGMEASLLFSAGYLAAIGTIDALVGKGDVVFSDALNHASLIDGCRLSGAKIVIYPHNDADALASLLKRHDDFSKKLIVSESLFSMDGDLAPLTDIARLAKQHEALLMVDEAHAVGVIGKRGQGACFELGIVDEVDVLLGTLGKALGSSGAFIAGSRNLIHYLVNKARTFIFQTALPPASAAAALESLKIIQSECSPIKQLRENISLMEHGLANLKQDQTLRHPASPIFPIILGDEQTSLDAASALLMQGLLIQAIRPPTVPVGTSRLRLTVSAIHRKSEIKKAIAAIGEITY